MLLSEFMTQAVNQVREENKYDIVKCAWEKKNWDSEDREVTGMCPLSCSLYVCTGELPNIQDKVNDDKYSTVEDTIRKGVIPALQSCCTINLTVQTLSTLIRIYDSTNWQPEDLIARIKIAEEDATIAEV